MYKNHCGTFGSQRFNVQEIQIHPVKVAKTWVQLGLPSPEDATP